jgi:hypothetical protein
MTGQGSLRTEQQWAKVINDGELPVWVANWSTDDNVTAKAGALIAMAFKDFTVRTTTNGVKNTVNVEETRYGSGNEREKKVFQITVQKKERAGRKIFRVQSYGEMMEGVLEEENVDNAKVAKSFPPETQGTARGSSRLGQTSSQPTYWHPQHWTLIKQR